MTVCRRRAPIFSVRSLTSKATSASRCTPDSANSSVNAFGGHQRRVLPAQRGVGLGQNAHEIAHHQRLELDADRQTALQFRNQVRGLRHVKRAGRDEQHMIGFDGAVLGVHRAALDQRQQVALHALARYVGAHGLLAARDLVDFIDEDDAVLFGVLDRAQLQFFLIDHFRRFLIDQAASMLP